MLRSFILALTVILALLVPLTVSADHTGNTVDVVDCRADGICTVVDGLYENGQRVDPTQLCHDAGLGAQIEWWRGLRTIFYGPPPVRQAVYYARCWAS